jgi:hypothetical protein
LAAGTPTCSGTLVCEETTSSVVGRCGTGSTVAPTVTSITGESYEVDSAVCTPEFPDFLSWTVNGSTSNPVFAHTLEAADFGAEAFEFGTLPFGPGSFSQEMGICSTVAPTGPVTIVLIDESGRTSAARSFTL